MPVVTIVILIWLIINWEPNNIMLTTEQASDSSYFFLYENQMSQKHILCDAHFPVWFATLENAVEECHYLSHPAALLYNV